MEEDETGRKNRVLHREPLCGKEWGDDALCLRGEYLDGENYGCR